MDFAIARRRMVERQVRERGISDPLVLEAMLQIPRHLFVEEALRSQAYSGFPLAYRRKTDNFPTLYGGGDDRGPAAAGRRAGTGNRHRFRISGCHSRPDRLPGLFGGTHSGPGSSGAPDSGRDRLQQCQYPAFAMAPSAGRKRPLSMPLSLPPGRRRFPKSIWINWRSGGRLVIPGRRQGQPSPQTLHPL